jgi:hypothetical protein
MQTIITKYIGPTDKRGSRISATTSGGSGRIVRPYRGSERNEVNHREAAKALAEKLEWSGKWIGGSGKGPTMVWVWIPACGNEDQFEV